MTNDQMQMPLPPLPSPADVANMGLNILTLPMTLLASVFGGGFGGIDARWEQRGRAPTVGTEQKQSIVNVTGYEVEPSAAPRQVGIPGGAKSAKRQIPGTVIF